MEFKEIKNRILFEDNHVMVFNKPAGIAVQADKTGDECLLDYLKSFIKERDQKGGNVFLGLVHRLDRPVSGIVVFAKSSKALTRLTGMFREREVEKIYHAIVIGMPEVHEATLTHHHKKDGKRHLAILTNKPGGETKPVTLHYKLLKRINENCLLEVKLETGKFHQIRAQLFKNGTPIVGDLKYGAKKPNYDRSVCLHAFRIEFKHPTREELLKIQAPYPKSQLWDNFRG